MAWTFSSTGKITLPNLAVDQDTMTGYAWAKGPGASNDSIFDVSNRLTFWWSGTNLVISTSNSSNYGEWQIAEASLGITVADWNHYAFTYDDSSGTNDPILYINGQSGFTLTENDAPGEFNNTSAAFYIGNFGSGTGPHEGPIAHVGIHNVVLTAGEIQTVYRRGWVPRGCLRYYPMTSPTTVADYSGNAQNASSTTGATHTTDHPPIRGPFHRFFPWTEPLKAAAGAPAAATPSTLMTLGVG